MSSEIINLATKLMYCFLKLIKRSRLLERVEIQFLRIYPGNLNNNLELLPRVDQAWFGPRPYIMNRLPRLRRIETPLIPYVDKGLLFLCVVNFNKIPVWRQKFNPRLVSAKMELRAGNDISSGGGLHVKSLTKGQFFAIRRLFFPIPYSG